MTAFFLVVGGAAVSALSVGLILHRLEQLECRIVQALGSDPDVDTQTHVDRATAILRQQNDALQLFIDSVRSQKGPS